MSKYKTLLLHANDSVAVALSDIPSQSVVTVKSDGKDIEVTILEPIRFGHKFAVKEIKQGENIMKYGEIIGAAVVAIQQGEHVHVHNLEGKRGRGDKIAK
ncbi:UxaA family hydrolase [Bacillus sp. JJ1562]|uniref:UxaA family hydrolase n=1 Tax=Bacillus sp. JJ1562 TaxID=3122960 RepID=UPI003003255A